MLYLRPIVLPLTGWTGEVAAEEETAYALVDDIRQQWHFANQPFIIDATEVDSITPLWWQAYILYWYRFSRHQVAPTMWLLRDDYEASCAHISLYGAYQLKTDPSWFHRFPYAILARVDGWPRPRPIGRMPPTCYGYLDYIIQHPMSSVRQLSYHFKQDSKLVRAIMDTLTNGGMITTVIHRQTLVRHLYYTLPCNQVEPWRP